MTIKMFLKKNKLIFFLLAITAIASLFRFYNLDWDDGNFFHPDERNIANAVSRIKFFTQLNPDFFAYGGLLIYLYRATGDMVAFFTNNANWIYDWGHINIIGRFYSALFSTLTIPAVFFLAKNIFNKRVAIIASLLASFTVSFIQTAHFSITENFLILISVLICISSLKLMENRNVINYLICGILIGLAAATKTTAISFIIFPLTAHILAIGKKPYVLTRRILFLWVFLLTSLAVFTAFSPYTFIKWGKFIESMKYESGVALGTLPVPYTLQFAKTTSYLFQMKNFLWQIGPVSYLLIPSFILLIIHIIKTKNHKLILFLSFPLIYFLYVGQWHTKFIRFMLPILPFIVILISYFLAILQKKTKIFGKILIIISILFTIIWAIAFFSIYTREQTRVTASKWIYENIPQGSRLLGEHWDDGLPVPIKSFNPTIYSIEQLTIYEPDNNEKINYLAQRLSAADYIILNSRRLYGTLINLKGKYPITSKYYKLLFDGELGYGKIKEFKSYPSIFGLEINDDASEETFQVYDHPKVIIFKNTGNLKNNHIKDLLNNNNL